VDCRHDRRALSVDELRRLLDASRNGLEHFGMTGPAGALLYKLAIETGLRARELANLTRARFTLEGDQPVVRVRAAYSKRRREDVLPLRSNTALTLRVFLAGRPLGAPAFAMPLGRLAAMIRTDLAAARQAWLAEVQPGQERDERERSSFLVYRDPAGRYADFHSLRHTCGSLLAAAGTHPKVAQTILRHSDINMTLSRYSHVFTGQAAAAVAALPNLT
jgi:integrase